MIAAAGALTVLADVLADLAAALERGREDEVLQIEPRLATAIDGVRAAGPLPALAGPSSTAILSLSARVRDEVAVCRRLGGSVPALLSVMFPGRVSYGRQNRAAVASIARMG